MQTSQKYFSAKIFIFTIINATLYMKLAADLALTLRWSFLLFQIGSIFFRIRASTSGSGTAFLHLK